MERGGNKVVKPQRTKFRKHKEVRDHVPENKQKHHDKSFYRLARQEKEDYVI